MKIDRARSELGWEPTVGAKEALEQALEGTQRGRGDATAPLAPDSLASRGRELLTGVGNKPDLG